MNIDIIKFKEHLKRVYDYMVINQSLERCDIIIGCGCLDVNVPKKCASLFKDGYASKILFTGGYGTKGQFSMPEAFVFKNVAMDEGVQEEDILVEDEATNTGDNFRYSLRVLEKNSVFCDKILIVHNALSTRRTYLTAINIFQNKKIMITYPELTFDTFYQKLKYKTFKELRYTVSVVLGDIQRIIVYPQLGWMSYEKVPESIIESYYILKEMGFDQFIMNKEKIDSLIMECGQQVENPIYFM
ncbi:MAG: YdcF family protein [Bacilli bacterium]|nr:YdcF family protein [Bacilli bacterium]